jgi:hypothetical protein
LNKFKKHVFISYAHRDNQAILDQQGWVTRFDEVFRNILGTRLGSDPIIWRDGEKVKGNSALTDEILNGLVNSALLITVVSPSYINSDWCRKELLAFCEQAGKSGDLKVERKSRILKVVKLPPESVDSLPGPLSELPGYPFYKEIQGGYNHELDPANKDDVGNFINAIVRLAADAERLIKKMYVQHGITEEAKVPGQAEPTETGSRPIRIYLADCTADLREARECLAADLKQNGCIVLPEHPLPASELSEYCEAVLRACQGCDISVHLIGSRYGAMPETAEPQPRSVVEIQNQIAAKLAGQTVNQLGLSRLIWLPDQLHLGDTLQRSFVERLNHESRLQVGADLIHGDFEELRTTLHRMIKSRRDVLAGQGPPRSRLDEKEETLNAPSQTPMVYLVCDKEDLKQTVPLRKWLKQHGYEVELPQWEGDATTIRNDNQELIKRCSAVVHFYGAGTYSWFRAIRSDHRKINAYRQGMQPIPRYLCLAEPDTPVKQDQLDVPDGDLTDVIDNRQGFDPSQWNQLVQALHAGRLLDA